MPSVAPIGPPPTQITVRINYTHTPAVTLPDIGAVRTVLPELHTAVTDVVERFAVDVPD